MPRHFVPPALADLSQDFAGSIPVTLIRDWLESSKSDKTQKDLLQPFLKTGIIVSSDSAGLSKLSAQRPLLEVTKLVSQPKEIIHAYGTAIGGEPVGTWVADNTLMFYPHTVPAATIVDQMVAAQQEIAPLTVQVGLGLHHAQFLRIGDGLFGADAAMIDEASENYTEGKEIILSENVKRLLPDSYHSQLKPRTDLNFAQPFYTLSYPAAPINPIKSDNYLYPLPFSREFFEKLRQLDLTDKQAADELYREYATEKIVVFIKIHQRMQPLFLDELTQWILASAVVSQTALEYRVDKVKSNGNLAIVLADYAKEAIDFAKHCRRHLKVAGYPSTSGISRGEVMIFNLATDGRDLTGNPVNIASKLAEDAGKPGHIYIHDSIVLPPRSRIRPFQVSLSHITLKGIIV